MVEKIESVPIKYCDICGAREGPMVHISQCWKCGKDVCGQHHHAVFTEGSIERLHTYLCTPDRDELDGIIKALFEEFSIAHSKQNIKSLVSKY